MAVGLDSRSELNRDERRHDLLGREYRDSIELSPERLLLNAQAVASHPCGLDQRETQQPLRTLRGEGQTRCAAARVAEEVEALKASRRVDWLRVRSRYGGRAGELRHLSLGSVRIPPALK
jgi:hypothetical protein